MSNDQGNLNDEARTRQTSLPVFFVIRASTLIRHSSFVIRHSSFVILAFAGKRLVSMSWLQPKPPFTSSTQQALVRAIAPEVSPLLILLGRTVLQKPPRNHKHS